MYSALWRILPGSRALKIVQLVIIVIIVLAVAVEYVFPWVADNVIQPETTVSE